MIRVDILRYENFQMDISLILNGAILIIFPSKFA